MTEHILIIEDDQKLLKLLTDELADCNYNCLAARNVTEAKQHLLGDQIPAVVVSDLNLPDGSGFDIIEHIKPTQPSPAMVIITAYGSIPQAVEALKQGADEFLTKPLNLEHFCICIDKLVKTFRLRNELYNFHSRVGDHSLHGLIGRSTQMHQLSQEIKQIAPAGGPVLITGESGVGKELVAKAIHAESNRSKGPFLAINCASLPAELLESEFFGHEKGAFTGAEQAKKGLFRDAEGGTLLLDEISEMPLNLQAKLLRVLQEKCIRPVGSSREEAVDVRVVATTNLDLESEVEKKLFREDLYYRLETFELYVPPLRDRKEDIDLLVAHFLNSFSSLMDKPCPTVTNEALEALHAYSYPGNVRELINIIERAITFCQTDSIEMSHLPRKLRDAGLWTANTTTTDRKVIPLVRSDEALPTLAELDRRYIHFVLEQTNGNKRRTASLLGIGRKTLYRWLAD
jgi:DNA-binding NtrC family response regulator